MHDGKAFHTKNMCILCFSMWALYGAHNLKVRHTVVVEDLEVLVYVHSTFEELLQVLEGNLHHVVIDTVV